MAYPHLVVARLHEYIEPIDRGERYEDPLESALRGAKAGTVTGGGSQMNALGGIDYVDVEIELADLEGALQLTIDVLEQAGAPQGAEILHDGEVIRDFGTQQCLAIYLDGISLPDDVYENLDFDAVVGQIGDAVGPGSYRGVWQGEEETGVYFFGPDADDMFTRVKPILGELPIGQNARVVIRHGKSSLEPRTVRMPRHEPQR